MSFKVIFPDGSEVPVNRVVKQDHRTTTFQVSIRSMSLVTPERLKRIIQTHFEVVGIEQLEGTIVVTPIT